MFFSGRLSRFLAVNDSMKLLAKFVTDNGVIRITRNKRGERAYYQNGCYHSQSNARGESLCAYIHAIFDLLRQKRARHVLMIGCAGGTLATMLRRAHVRVTVVDIHALSFVIARRYFAMPEAVRCVRRDGIAILRTSRQDYDAIVIDVFASDNTVPKNFTTPHFFELVERRLRQCGIMVMNVMVRNDRDTCANTITCHAKATGKPVTLLDWPGEKNRNALIVAGDIQNVRIPSRIVPKWIKSELQQIVKYRKPSFARSPRYKK